MTLPGTALPGLLLHAWRVDTLLIVAGWLLAIAATLVSFRRSCPPGARGWRALWRFCLPGGLRGNTSIRTDILFVALAQALRPVLAGPLLIGASLIAVAVHGALADGRPPAAAPLGWLPWALLLLAVLLLRDACNFGAHWLLHRVPALWELHKVHHSAEFLIPLTNRRVHPWQEVVEDVPPALLVGVLLGLAARVGGWPITETAAIGTDAYYVANVVTFYHLRHSHVPMGFGRLEWLLVSPAQHQLHHSIDPRHYGSNLGGVLACWDRWAGTWRRSQPSLALQFGLPAAERAHYRTLWQLYAGAAWRMLQCLAADCRPSRRPPAIGSAGSPAQ